MECQPMRAMKRFNYLLGEMDAAYHEISWKLGLSDSAMSVLYTICDSGTRRSLREICRYSGLSKQTVNSALRKLEAEGMIYLEPAGAKGKTVCLTGAGEALAERTAGKIIQMEDSIFAAWPREDVQRYLELTEAFLAALRERGRQL